MTDKVDLAATLATFTDHWQPRTVSRFNECDVMVVKAHGEFGGVEHRPGAAEEVHLLLMEPSGTPHTGDAATAAPRRVV